MPYYTVSVTDMNSNTDILRNEYETRKEANQAFADFVDNYNLIGSIRESETGHNKSAGGQGYEVFIHLQKQY